jgi:hypothetical protein
MMGFRGARGNGKGDLRASLGPLAESSKRQGSKDKYGGA